MVVGKVMNVNASFDHRFIDGFHAGVLASTHAGDAGGPVRDRRFDELPEAGGVTGLSRQYAYSQPPGPRAR